MADSPFRIKKSAVLVPVATPSLTQQGELAYDSSDDKLKVRGASTTDAVVSENKTQDLNNKTIESSVIDADLNTISNIDNADIKAGAAIEVAKLAALTTNRAVQSNGSGVLEPSSVTSTELGHLSGVTSAIQTQLNSKVDEVASTDNAIVRFDGTGGAVQNSAVVISDANALTGATSIVVDSLTIDNATISSTANPLLLVAASGFDVNMTVAGGAAVGIQGGPLRLPEISTPATPSSGFGHMYFKSDGFAYQQNDDGTETKIGEGAGGINYIENPDAESSTSGWATYADAASSRPVDGTGGSPNVTWTRSTSSPLRGVASFLFTKDAANRQGQGASYDFTIDNADLARVLQISFDYEIASGTYSGGTSSTDSDLIVYIYRTTATGRLIEPSVIKLDGGVAGVKYSYRGEFQSDSDATGYRLILHVATTSASAFTVKFDNVVLGPSQNVNGAIVGPWQDYPSIPTLGGYSVQPTIDYLKWRRVGDILQVNLRVSGGTLSASDWTLPLPAGLVAASTTLRAMGVGNSESSTASRKELVAWTSATSAFFVSAQSDFSGGTLVGTALAGGSNRITIIAETPIVGWGATATLGQDADTRVLAMEAYKASGAQTSSGSYQDVSSLTLVKTDGLNFDATTGIGTITVAGWYLLDAQVGFDYNAAGVRYVAIDVNGTRVAYDTNEPLATNTTLCHTQKIVYLVAGNTFKMQAFQNSGGNLNYATTEGFRPRLSAMRMSGPSQMAASEVVALKYLNTAGTSITSAVVDVPFATKVFDTHNAFNGATGVFTAPATGKYRITGNLYSQAVTLSTSQSFDIRFKVTSTPEGLSAATLIKQLTYGNGASIAATANASEIYDLVAGNTLQISAASDVTVGLSTSSGRNFICIERIGGIG